MRSHGRWLAGGILVAAAAYELTPLKDVCLGKCRSPLGFLLGSWREGPSGALRMGMEHGAWCVGCCGIGCEGHTLDPHIAVASLPRSWRGVEPAPRTRAPTGA